MDLYITLLFTSAWFAMWLTMALVRSFPEVGVGLATVGLLLALGLGTPMTLFDRRRGAAVSLLGLLPLLLRVVIGLALAVVHVDVGTGLFFLVQFGLLVPSLIACALAIQGPETRVLPFHDGVLAVLASIPPVLAVAWLAVLLLLWGVVPG